jgi:hypothetical protein
MNLEEIRQTEWYQNLHADRQSLDELGHQIVELAGQIFIKAIEAASDDVSEPNVSAESATVKFRLDPPARKADALTVMAESFLAQGAAALRS